MVDWLTVVHEGLTRRKTLTYSDVKYGITTRRLIAGADATTVALIDEGGLLIWGASVLFFISGRAFDMGALSEGRAFGCTPCIKHHLTAESNAYNTEQQPSCPT